MTAKAGGEAICFYIEWLDFTVKTAIVSAFAVLAVLVAMLIREFGKHWWNQKVERAAMKLRRGGSED